MISPRHIFACWFVLSGILVAAAFSAGCRKQERSFVGEGLPCATVRLAVVEEKAERSKEEVVGTVRAKSCAAIEAKVSARIEALFVAPGQTVRAGELLAQLDAREIQAKLDQALALREQATRDLARARDLMEKKVTTRAEFDAVLAREQVAVGSVRETETTLGYTKLVAPFAGIITRKLADVGDLAAPGRPIIEMEDQCALRFEADVPEALIGNVALGAKLSVRAGSVATAVEGTVVEMAPIANAASRTFLVKLDLPPAEAARSGQFGRVWVATGDCRKIRVPAAAVVSRGQMDTVFVAASDHVQLRIVRTGKRIGGEVELLSGIEAGESIAIEGAEQLRDGQSIARLGK